jgi:predicted RNase H-like nuclease (RuvC/YqgF family)
MAEEDIELLKQRPVGTGSGTGSGSAPVVTQTKINTDNFVSKDDIAALIVRLSTQERYMLEHDERLTNNEHRISKLEDMISEPMDRIAELEKRVDNIKFELHNKVNANDLYK